MTAMAFAPAWQRTACIRRTIFFILVGVTACTALFMLGSAFQQDGLMPLELGLLLLYALLMFWVSLSFWTAILGWLVLTLGGDRQGLVRKLATAAAAQDRDSWRTALVMPIYNEDPKRVFAGLKLFGAHC
ncbi:MAG: hypothetical protein N3A55_04325 [Methylohalobius sp.]|nr:hypothetical protein [Methylohalobius sp.]